MMPRSLLVVLALAACWPLPAEEALIRVETAGPPLPVTTTMTGACLEDVNHEVYGGIDSQMIFGEGFQEPALAPPLKDAVTYGGRWIPQDGILLGQDGGNGPRLISASGALSAGQVGVEIRFAGRGDGNAALLIAVSGEAGMGSDRFDGYEIALLPAGKLSIGRHHHDYRLIREVPCPVPTGTWIPLEARIDGSGFEVLVAGASLVRICDPQPLPPGGVGLRLWRQDADFRGWWRADGSGRRDLVLAHQDERSSWHHLGVSGMWDGASTGTASGSFALAAEGAFSGKQSQRVTHAAGEGWVGIENRGLHRRGMVLRAGRPYAGFVCVRAPVPAGLAVMLQDAAGERTVAEASLAGAPGSDEGAGWRRLDFTLTPDCDVAAGRFAIGLHQPGTADIGYAFLQPGEWGRYRGLPVRRDVVAGLIAQGITVLRYGGSMVNHAAYRWRNMTGPREHRPGTPGTWYGYASNGWGIVEFMSLCEAMPAVAIPVINADESPQDAADLVEYMNGPLDSPGGRRRAADGHPAPFNLRYLEIGNEEHVDAAYAAKFSAIAERVWALPEPPILVVGDFTYYKPVADPYHIAGAAGAPSMAGHQRLLALAKAHQREIWFDVHVFTDNIKDNATIDAIPSVLTALSRIADGARFKVGIFELNADHHTLGRAIQNAYAIGRFMRLGGQIPVVCSANCLQVDGANDNGWDQGLLFMDGGKVWPQPPYFATQLLSRSRLPWVVPATSSDARLDVTALVSDDRRLLQLNIVNRSADAAIPAAIALDRHASTLHAMVLTGPGDAVNSAQQTDRIVPVSVAIDGGGDGPLRHTFPAQSLTVIRCE